MQLVYSGGDEALIEEAWREWRQNASLRGTPSDHFEVKPPRWFVREELGFAIEHGPSLRWTCSNLAHANRSALKHLLAFFPLEVPDRVTYPIDFQKTRGARRRKRA